VQQIVQLDSQTASLQVCFFVTPMSKSLLYSFLIPCTWDAINRRCGVLVCAPCSRQRLAASVQVSPSEPTKLKETRVRVCDDCASSRPSVRFSTRPSLTTSPNVSDSNVKRSDQSPVDAIRLTAHSSSSSNPRPPSLNSQGSRGSISGSGILCAFEEPGEDATAAPLVGVFISLPCH